MSESSGNSSLRKGSWTKEEDNLLKQCIQKFGEGKWHLVPSRAGLNRCRKSCRLRWLNYLKPDINRGEFMEDEIDLIAKLHRLLGNRWSLIAGRIPGRTANDIKNYWNTHLRKKMDNSTTDINNNNIQRSNPSQSNEIIRPRPWKFYKQSHDINLSTSLNVAVAPQQNKTVQLNDNIEFVDYLWDNCLNYLDDPNFLVEEENSPLVDDNRALSETNLLAVEVDCFWDIAT